MCSRLRYWQVKGSLSNEAACLNRPKFSFKMKGNRFILCAQSINGFSGRDGTLFRSVMKSLGCGPSFSSSMPIIITLSLLERASRSSNFSSRCLTFVVRWSSVNCSVERMSEWVEPLSSSSFRAASCLADLPLSSEIDFWIFSLRDEISTLMVAETSVMRFSIVAKPLIWSGSPLRLKQRWLRAPSYSGVHPHFCCRIVWPPSLACLMLLGLSQVTRFSCLSVLWKPSRVICSCDYCCVYVLQEVCRVVLCFCSVLNWLLTSYLKLRFTLPLLLCSPSLLPPLLPL